MSAQVVKGQEEKGAKFSDYFAHSEKWAGVPSHRALAMMRGANEGVLTLDIGPDADGLARVAAMVEDALGVAGDAARRPLADATSARWAWKVKLGLSMMLDLMGSLRERAQEEAIRVFARNLRDLLLAAPAGARATMGLDPGVRTGVKVAVVDATGKLLATDTVYPFQPRNDVRGAQAALAGLIGKHGVELIAIGNGTASRETERLVADLLALLPAGGEADEGDRLGGGGVGLLGLGAGGEGVSRARRVAARARSRSRGGCRTRWRSWSRSSRRRSASGSTSTTSTSTGSAESLEEVVEDAVNAVGVDLNTASAPLLAHVSGLGPSLAEAIVAHRDDKGAFRSRKALLKVARLGPRAFEQAAGFLRIRDGDEPLDASAVHPEGYARGAADRGRLRARPARADGRRGAAARRSIRRDFVDDALRAADGEGHPRRAGEAGARPAPGLRDADASRRASRRSRT